VSADVNSLYINLRHSNYSAGGTLINKYDFPIWIHSKIVVS